MPDHLSQYSRHKPTQSWSISNMSPVQHNSFTATFFPLSSATQPIVGDSLQIWPAQITQSYADDCPSNSVGCLALQIQLAKTNNLLFLVNPTGKDACQLDLLRTVCYIVFVSWICQVYSISPSAPQSLSHLATEPLSQLFNQALNHSVN